MSGNIHSNCSICRGELDDHYFDRIEVWQDDLWRLTVSLSSEVPGFAYLEPKRHVPYITDLDGVEAASFGPVLARCTRILREVTRAEVVYAYIFGDSIPHLHVHLAPHRKGDGLNDQFIRGEVVEEKLPNGAIRVISNKFPPLPRLMLETVANQVRERLNSESS
jgi:diadenosine tetraphosphate (Ap4A) HIT family hydrolase